MPSDGPQHPLPLRASAVLASLRWSYGTAAFGGLLQLGVMVALARLLGPADYGGFAAAIGLLRFLQYFSDLGIASTVIQKPDFQAELDAPPLFLAALGANALLIAAIWLATPYLADLLPGLPAGAASLLGYVALAALPTGMGQVALALLRRRFAFRALALQGLAAQALGGAGAVAAALAGGGHWSLVLGLLLQTTAGAALAMARVRHPLRPARRWRSRLPSLLRTGGGFMLLRVLDSAGLHLLPLVVVLLAGAAEGGLWDRAFALAVMSVELLAAGLGQVLFPAYSRLAGEPERLARAWLSVLAVAACLFGGLAGGLVAAGPELVAVVLGGHWQAAAGAFGWLAPWAALRCFAMIDGALCEAVGRLRLRAAFQAAYLAGLALLLLSLRPTSAADTARLLLAFELPAQLALLAVTARLCGVRPLVALRHAGIGLLPATLVLAGTGAGAAALRASSATPAITLAATVGISACLLAAGVLLHPAASFRRMLADRLLGQGATRPATVALSRWLAR